MDQTDCEGHLIHVERMNEHRQEKVHLSMFPFKIMHANNNS